MLYFFFFFAFRKQWKTKKEKQTNKQKQKHDKNFSLLFGFVFFISFFFIFYLFSFIFYTNIYFPVNIYFFIFLNTNNLFYIILLFSFWKNKSVDVYYIFFFIFVVFLKHLSFFYIFLFCCNKKKKKILFLKWSIFVSFFPLKDPNHNSLQTEMKLMEVHRIFFSQLKSKSSFFFCSFDHEFCSNWIHLDFFHIMSLITLISNRKNRKGSFFIDRNFKLRFLRKPSKKFFFQVKSSKGIAKISFIMPMMYGNC